MWPITLAALWRLGLRGRRAVALCLAVAGLVAVNRAVAWLGGAGVDRVSNGTDMRADALLIGSALALALESGMRLRAPLALTAAAAGFLAWMVATQSAFTDLTYVGGLTLVALASAVVILALLQAPGALSARPLVALGRISYAVYLWHFPVVFLVPLGWRLEIRVLLVVTITLIAATGSWFLVEQRFLKLKPARAPARVERGG